MRIKTFNSFKKLNRLLQSGAVFCAFDTETTGISPTSDRVIELGAVKFTKDGIISTFSQFFNPGITLPPFITSITHITEDMLEDAPKIGDVVQDFLDFSKDTVLLAHNAPFDVKFMNAELARALMPPLTNTVIDTLALSRWTYPDNKTWKLQSLASQFKIKVKAAHRAYDDARVCMELFLKCIADSMEKQLAVKEIPVSERDQIQLF